MEKIKQAVLSSREATGTGHTGHTGHIPYVDIAKGIGIFLVVAGHCFPDASSTTGAVKKSGNSVLHSPCFFVSFTVVPDTPPRAAQGFPYNPG